MTERLPSPEQLIDAYLNGGLEGEERDAFERMAERSPDLRTEVERQERINRALRRIVQPPSAERLGAIADEVVERLRYEAPAPRTRRLGRRRLAVAAAVAAGLVGSWLLVDSARSRWGGSGGYVAPPWASLETVYRNDVSDGFRPLWRCETDEEFARTFGDRFGQELLLAALPAGTEALGIAYCNCLTPRTTYVLATVEGEPVIVFVDRIEADLKQTPPPDLNLFRRQLGLLVLYELTPREQSALLERFYDPEDGR